MICKTCENPILKSEKYFRPPHGGYRHEDCVPAKMRRRIEVLEEENFRLIAEVDRDTGLCSAAAKRIEELEKRISSLEAALREIADMECTDFNDITKEAYMNGHRSGHRCAAKIAREALESK